MKLDHDKVKKLYLEGKSTYQIADLLGYKQDSVKQWLIYNKLIRPALGRDIEEEVALWFESRGSKVIRQKGDAPFDLIINGGRADVKSSNIQDNHGIPCFRFQLQDAKVKKEYKVFPKVLDYFILVFMIDKYPMYRISSRHPYLPRFCLNIPATFKTAHPLIYIGNLRDK